VITIVAGATAFEGTILGPGRQPHPCPRGWPGVHMSAVGSDESRAAAARRPRAAAARRPRGVATVGASGRTPTTSVVMAEVSLSTEI
jgi:hypothetical protein